MQSLSKYNKGDKYLFCAIDLFIKYVWVVPIKDKKGISIVNAFQKVISKGRKPDFLEVNNIGMYSTYNEGKSVVAERFRTLKNKIFKDMAAISKDVYFNVLDDIVNKYNTVHRTIKMKPIDVADDSYAEYSEDFNKKILNLKLLTMLKFQNIKTFL